MQYETHYHLRQANAGDLSAIFGLLKACDLPVDGLVDHLASVIVLEAQQDLLGTATLEIYGPHALLRSLAVQEAFRNLGLGRRLTQFAMEMARQNGVETLYLLTLSAEKFFRTLGFERIERNQVPASVQQSVEFSLNCCDSAVAMCKRLSNDG